MKKSNKLKYLLTLLMILSISFSVFGINTSSIKAKASDGITAENLNFDKDTNTLTFKLNINRKVKSGEEIVINVPGAFFEIGGNTSRSANTDIKLKDGTVIGYMYSENRKVHIVFNDEATTYETLSFDVTSVASDVIPNIYKDQGVSEDVVKDFPFNLRLYGDIVSIKPGIFKDYQLKTYTQPNWIIHDLSASNDKNDVGTYINMVINSGKIKYTMPDGMKINSLDDAHFNKFAIQKLILDTEGNKNNYDYNTGIFAELENNKAKYLTLSPDGKTLTFNFDNTLLSYGEMISLHFNPIYEPGFSYQDNPTRKILVDYTGLNMPNLTTKELEIKKAGETTSANGSGTIKDVIPVVDTNTIKPDNYVTVTMDPKENGRLQDTVSQYYVTTKKQVSIPAKDPIANVGYTFNKWDTPLTNTFKSDTTISATYNKLNDIIPIVDNNTTKPDGYVTVSFNKGDHGSLLGNTSYYVNPKANKKLNDLAPLPKIIPDTDYIFDKYSP